MPAHTRAPPLNQASLPWVEGGMGGLAWALERRWHGGDGGHHGGLLASPAMTAASGEERVRACSRIRFGEALLEPTSWPEDGDEDRRATT